MPLVLKELASSDATNRRNAAFCVGELCKNGGAITLKYPFFEMKWSVCIVGLLLDFLLSQMPAWMSCNVFFPIFILFLVEVTQTDL